MTTHFYFIRVSNSDANPIFSASILKSHQSAVSSKFEGIVSYGFHSYSEDVLKCPAFSRPIKTSFSNVIRSIIFPISRCELAPKLYSGILAVLVI